MVALIKKRAKNNLINYIFIIYLKIKFKPVLKNYNKILKN